MADPLGTTKRRKFAFFLVAWGYVVGAILVQATGRPSMTVDVVTAPGWVYVNVRDVLENFAATAGVSPAVVLAIYVLLGLFVVTLAIYLLDAFAFEEQDYVAGLTVESGFTGGIVTVYLLLAVWTVGVLLFAAFVSGTVVTVDRTPYQQQKLLPNWGVFAAAASFVLVVAPQFLTLACIGLVISFLTVYVP